MIQNQNTEAPQETKAQVMACTSSVPQRFYLTGTRNKSLVMHVHGATPQQGKLLPGSVVSNVKKPGSFGLTVALPIEEGNNDQVLINTIHSNNVPSSTTQFTFSKMHSDLAESRPMQMTIHVKKISGGTGSNSLKPSNNLGYPIPVIVGPSSISAAEDFTEEEFEILGLDALPDVNWGNLAKNVISALPVIADAGFKIYEQVSGSNKTSQEGEPEFIGALLGAVGSIAVPLISKLLP